jgi:hypothetical protein
MVAVVKSKMTLKPQDFSVYQLIKEMQAPKYFLVIFIVKAVAV